MFWGYIKNWAVKEQPMHFGIDVSHNNGKIDWKGVTTNSPKVDFAYMKSTEGSTYMDNRFFENVKGCVANGIPWGAYHFATWNNEDEALDATQEAQFFLSIVKGAGVKPTMPLVLDVETNKPIPYTKDEMVLYVKTFTDRIITSGYDAMIYASPGFLNQYFPSNHPFTGIKWWAADYSGEVNPVPGWKKPYIRQFTQAGRVNGILTNVDLNSVI